MRIIDEINLIVKNAGSVLDPEGNKTQPLTAYAQAAGKVPREPAKPVITVADRSLDLKNNSTSDVLRRILKRDDENGSQITWFIDRKTGKPYITPRMSRRNVYRDNFKKILGDKYRQEDADRIADEDYEQALKERYSRLKKIFHMPRFSNKENYTIAPTDATVSVGNNAYTAGSIDSKVPIRLMNPSLSTDPLGKVEWTDARNVSKILWLDLYLRRLTGRNVALHEMSHTVDIPSNSNSLVKYIAPGNSAYKDLRYARIPQEKMVGVLNEKSRLRAMGNRRSGIGDVWVNEMVKGIKNGWKPDQSKKSGRTWDLNVDSLKSIFYEVYEKAHRPNATDRDRMEYELMVKDLKNAFEQASNSPVNRGKFMNYA